MKQIIRRGTKKKYLICRECGCYFSYEFDDIKIEKCRLDLYNCPTKERKVVTCPQCNESLYLVEGGM